MSKDIKLNSDKHEICFDDGTCRAIELCKALCCRNWDINLALEEYRQEIYKAESFCSQDKTVCLKEDKPCPQRTYRLKKNKDASCIYLNKENQCEIYSTRPIVCRNFICDKGFKIEPIASVAPECQDEAEICSFEGGLDLKTKFMFNPYLRIKKVQTVGSSLRLTFNDVTSCKEKVTNIRGSNCFSQKKEAVYFFKLCNGKNTLKAVLNKMLEKMERDEFLNLALYLIDEKVLVGVF
jgi:Fe-S-cluster containining protein